MNMQRLNRSGSRKRHSYRKASILVSCLLFSLTMWGCSALFLVPVTLKEVKDYVSERKQSFSNTLDEVLVSAGYSLKALDFELKRIEYVGSRGLIHASTKDTAVHLNFDAVTSNLTRMRSKIITKNGVRYFSSEEELFNQIREELTAKNRRSFMKIGDGMTPVYLKQDIKSKVVAFFAPGEEVKISAEEQPELWISVRLKSGGSGYIDKRHIAPLPKPKDKMTAELKK